MRVEYVGPLCEGADHPELSGYNLQAFPETCYLVSVCEDAGVTGPLIEGDMLIVDEARPPGHGDLVIVDIEDEQHLLQIWRPGWQLRLRPYYSRGESLPAYGERLRGVVISQARRYAI